DSGARPVSGPTAGARRDRVGGTARGRVAHAGRPSLNLALKAELVQPGRMSRPCEVCSGLEPLHPAGGRTRRLLIEQRIVALCDQHAAAYRSSGISTLAELRAMFVESSGRRSPV